MADLEKYDRLVKLYETAAGQGLAEDVKAGVVIRSLGARHAQLAQHMVLQGSRLNSYQLLRQELVDVLRTKRFLADKDGPVPMDIGALQTLGKDTKCHVCGKKGHLARD
eukprot:824125-Amphidinium_carterae.1